jgi:hypothetical protein
MGYLMEEVSRKFTYEQVYLHLLFKAYPFLKKRESENPEPELVNLVKQIEKLIQIESGE